MAKNNRRIPLGTVLIRTSAVLFCLVLITTYLTAGLYARYTASSESRDSARVAKFQVDFLLEQAKDDENQEIEGQYALTVSNQSEVAVRYQIVVELTSPMSVALNDGEAQTPAENETTVTFTDESWTLAPGAEGVHTLQLAVADWTGLTSEDTHYIETEPVTFGFEVSVTAEQID